MEIPIDIILIILLVFALLALGLERAIRASKKSNSDSEKPPGD